MSDGLSYERAAAILGCHVSNVAELIRKGELTWSLETKRAARIAA